MNAGDIDSLDWDKHSGLIPAIVQHAATGEVRMLAWMNRDALARTLDTGLVHFYSRSRQSLWQKGESSGNVLQLRDLRADCDADALLVTAVPAGPTCHTGAGSCFGAADPAGGDSLSFLTGLSNLIRERADADPATSYTAQLLAAGPRQAARKVGEEAVEVVLAALCESDDAVIDEAADLLYHLMVLLRTRGLALDDVARRLADRHHSQVAGS